MTRVTYSTVRELTGHLKPEIESHSLASVSWAFHLEFVKDENGNVIK